MEDGDACRWRTAGTDPDYGTWVASGCSAGSSFVRRHLRAHMDVVVAEGGVARAKDR